MLIKPLKIRVMEVLTYFVMNNGTVIITSLIGAIVLCIFFLSLMMFHQPGSAVTADLGLTEHLEDVLKRVLSNHSSSSGKGAQRGSMDSDQMGLLTDQIVLLEQEIVGKQKEIEALQEGGGDGGDWGEKVQELEERLAEYEVIEEDIADLSRYRQENIDLKERLATFEGGGEAATSPEASSPPAEKEAAPAEQASPEEEGKKPWDEFEQVIKNKQVDSPKDKADKKVNETA